MPIQYCEGLQTQTIIVKHFKLWNLHLRSFLEVLILVKYEKKDEDGLTANKMQVQVFTWYGTIWHYDTISVWLNLRGLLFASSTSETQDQLFKKYHKF